MFGPGDNTTMATFTYEIRLDVGGAKPVMIGFQGEEEHKLDLDLILAMILDYADKVKQAKKKIEAQVNLSLFEGGPGGAIN